MLRSLLTALLVLMSATAVAADGKTWPAASKPAAAAPAPAYAHLHYFGFYASAMGHWNFTEELAEFTNLTWIHLGVRENPAAAIGDIALRLAEAQAAGVKAVLSIEPFVFADRKGTPRSDIEIEDLLRELLAEIEARDLLGTVAMIYPKDEPFREFVRHRDPSYWDKYVTGDVYQDVHTDLLHVNDRIKAVFPDIPLGVILSGYDLHHEFFSIPENYDWVGFNCYSSMFRGCEDRETIIDHYERLLAYMQPRQRLLAVPETWARNESLDEPDWPVVLSKRFRHHYEIALSEPRFIAFVPFIWSFEADNEVPGKGLDRFAELYDDGIGNVGSAFVAEVIGAGLQIKEARPHYPNLAWHETEDHRRRPPPNVRAGISGIGADGTLRAWAVDDALPHKNLRVQLRIRDARGRLLHRAPLQRTDRVDHGLGVATTVGLHGFHYRLPDDVQRRYRKSPLTAELSVFEDGPGRRAARVERMSFQLQPGLPRSTALR